MLSLDASTERERDREGERERESGVSARSTAREQPVISLVIGIDPGPRLNASSER